MAFPVAGRRFHHDRSINQAERHTSAIHAGFGHKVTLARDDFHRIGRRQRRASSVRNVDASGRIGRVRYDAIRALPLYASIGGGAHSVPAILKAVAWIAPIAGLALAAAMTIAAPKPPRLRVMIGLTAFGLIHLLAQRKGWSYHFYPLAVGFACWGAWTLAALPAWRMFACLIVFASALVWLRPDSMSRVENDAASRASLAMQSALESRLPCGARVQMLDSDSGAMARAGMRQATPHIQWFSLLFAKDSVRRDFLAALKADPPAVILLTNDQWPKGQGFEAADDWSEFTALLTLHYDL
jgi:hypothetical protein